MVTTVPIHHRAHPPPYKHPPHPPPTTPTIHARRPPVPQVVDQADAIHADLGIDIMYGTIGTSEKRLMYPPKKGEAVRAKSQKKANTKLAEPRYRRRKGNTSGVVKSALEWEMYRACKTPGPGAYDCPMPGGGNELHLSGKFGESGESNLQVFLKSKAYVPSPQDYDPPKQLWGTKGVVFANGRTDTDDDMKLKEAAHQPGPGQYAVSGTKMNSVNGKVPGGVWTKKPREFKLSDRGGVGSDGKATPGPGEYKTECEKQKLGGKISITQRPSFLNDLEKRGYNTPGPGRYKVESDHRTRPPSGGKFNEAKTKSEVRTLHLAEAEAKAEVVCVRDAARACIVETMSLCGQHATTTYVPRPPLHPPFTPLHRPPPPSSSG